MNDQENIQRTYIDARGRLVYQFHGQTFVIIGAQPQISRVWIQETGVIWRMMTLADYIKTKSERT